MRTLATLLSLVVLTSACGGDQTPSSAREASEQATGVGEGLVTAATVFPLAWLAQEVAPGAEVAFLGARGQDPHGLELSPADREVIETADVLLYMGDIDFQPQVEQATGAATGEVLSVVDAVGPERLLPAEPDDHADDDHADDDHADDDHADDGHADHADDERGAIDPHVWFDAAIMADVARQVGETFAAADPEHTDDYTANAQAAAEELTALDGQIDELLDECRFDTVIVSHEAYAYLLAPRGLQQEGISGPGGHSEASPQRLAELTERIRDQDIPAVAAEPVEGRADAEVLVSETDAELVDIDPLEVADADQLAAGYPHALRAQAEAFAAALDCT